MDFLFTQHDAENTSEEEKKSVKRYADELLVTKEFRGEKRFSIEFILDTSNSMGNEGKIDKLNKTIEVCINHLLSLDEATCVDVGIITMGGTTPEIAVPLETVYHYPIHMNQVYEANGNALVGKALQMAVDEVSERRKFYRRNMIAYYRPKIVMLSDGFSTCNEKNGVCDEQAIQQCAEFVKSNSSRATFYTFYICSDNEICSDSEARETMKRFASNIEPIRYGYESTREEVYAYILDKEEAIFKIFNLTLS